MITVVIVFTILLNTNSFADCSSTGYSNVDVEILYPNIGGTIYVGTSGGETKADCAVAIDVYFKFDISQPGGAAIYSTLLTAQTADKKLAFELIMDQTVVQSHM